MYENLNHHRARRNNEMATADNILKEALTLRPSEKAQLIDKLISSLDKSDEEIDKLWANEAEDRIDAFDQGRLKAISLEKVLQKYR
jgi:putative addiction module component (TIGR02574 family)